MKKHLTSIIAVIVTFGIGYTSFFLIQAKKELITTDVETNISSKRNTVSTPVDENPSLQKRLNNADELYENNYREQAIKEYQKAIQANPKSLRPYLGLGELYFLERDYDSAMRYIELADRIAPDDPAVDLIEAKINIANDEMDIAYRILNGTNKDNPAFQFYLGLINTSKRNTDVAKSNFKLAERSEDTVLANSASLMLNHYRSYEKIKDIDITYLQTLIGNSAVELNEIELAIPIAYDVINQDPWYRDAWIILGYANLELEKFDEARDAFIRARDIDGNHAETRFYLGVSYYGLNLLKPAATEFKEALDNDYRPQIHVHQKLAEIYYKEKDYESSVKHYEILLQLNGDDVNLFVRPVWIYLAKLDDLDKAEALAKRALNKHPESAMGYNLMGWALVEKGEFESAENYLLKSIEISSNFAPAYLNLGLMEEKRSNDKKAMEYYGKAYDINPNDSIGQLAAERFNILTNK